MAKTGQEGAAPIDMADVDQEQLEAAITIDQLMEEFAAAKAAGVLSGSEKVIFGDGFMRQCSAVRAITVMREPGGSMVAGLSAQSELEWAALLSAVEVPHLSLNASEMGTTEDAVRRLAQAGLGAMASTVESRELGRMEAPAATPSGKKSAL